MQINLRQIPCPVNSIPAEPPIVPPKEYERRIQTLYDAANSDWVVVYADREHFAKLSACRVNKEKRRRDLQMFCAPQG